MSIPDDTGNSTRAGNLPSGLSNSDVPQNSLRQSQDQRSENQPHKRLSCSTKEKDFPARSNNTIRPQLSTKSEAMWTHGAHYLILVSGKSLPKPLGFFNIGAKARAGASASSFARSKLLKRRSGLQKWHRIPETSRQTPNRPAASSSIEAIDSLKLPRGLQGLLISATLLEGSPRMFPTRSPIARRTSTRDGTTSNFKEEAAN